MGSIIDRATSGSHSVRRSYSGGGPTSCHRLNLLRWRYTLHNCMRRHISIRPEVPWNHKGTVLLYVKNLDFWVSVFDRRASVYDRWNNPIVDVVCPASCGPCHGGRGGAQVMWNLHHTHRDDKANQGLRSVFLYLGCTQHRSERLIRNTKLSERTSHHIQGRGTLPFGLMSPLLPRGRNARTILNER